MKIFPRRSFRDTRSRVMMIVDTSKSDKPFGEMVEELNQIGEEIGVKIRCQHEDIFTKMHRI